MYFLFVECVWMLIPPVCCYFPDGSPRNAPLSPHGDAPHGAETPQHAPSAPRDDASDDAPHGRAPHGPGKAIPAAFYPFFPFP